MAEQWPYWFIAHDQVDNVRRLLGCERVVPDLLSELVRQVKVYARCVLSQFQVGVVGVTKRGNIYCGVNVEFPPGQLNTCIHAEQCLVANMLAHDDVELVTFLSDVPPCGHCRQFFKELPTEKELTVWIVRSGDAVAMPLEQLLPHAFGPADLNSAEGIAAGPPAAPRFVASSPLADHHHHRPSVDEALLASMKATALDAINRSYSPYSASPCAVVLATEQGRLYAGWYIENAAYTPSLAPFQSAACGMVRDHLDWSAITACLLIEAHDAKITHRHMTRALLEQLAPSAALHCEVASSS